MRLEEIRGDQRRPEETRGDQSRKGETKKDQRRTTETSRVRDASSRENKQNNLKAKPTLEQYTHSFSTSALRVSWVTWVSTS